MLRASSFIHSSALRNVVLVLVVLPLLQMSVCDTCGCWCVSQDSLPVRVGLYNFCDATPHRLAPHTLWSIDASFTGRPGQAPEQRFYRL